MNSSQLHQSYVLGMFWFIFFEIMFFAAFLAPCSTYANLLVRG